MANVDQCTRYAEAGLCSNAHANALKIATINNNLRNIIFRGKTADQIEYMLLSFSNKIKEIVSSKFNFTCKTLIASSDNNKEGADLYCVTPFGEKITIEVKFGSYTDKAAGMNAFSKIFDTQIFSEALSNVQRKSWQEMVKNEYPDLSKQLKRTIDTLNQAASDFNEFIASHHHQLSKQSQNFMEDYLLNNSGNYESHTDNYIRFEVAKDGSDIYDVATIQKGYGTWLVDDIDLIDPSNDKPRINVFAHNDQTNLQVKFTLNNKNDLHITDPPITVRSKYMLNSPSWNVWIRKTE